MVPAENLETIVPGPEGVIVIGYVGPDTLMTIANNGSGTSSSTETRYNTGTPSSNSSGTTLTNTSVGPSSAINTTPNTSVTRSGGAGSGSSGGPGSGSGSTAFDTPPPGLTKPGLTLGTGGPSGVNGNAFNRNGIVTWWSNTFSRGFSSGWMAGNNFLTNTGNFAGGANSTLTFGLSDYLAHAFGWDPNYNSDAYRYGMAVGSASPWSYLGKMGFGTFLTKNPVARNSVNEIKWTLGTFKSDEKWASQLKQRGWTSDLITEALDKGKKFPAENLVNPGNPATRYVHPTTGKSIVLDNVTHEIIHVGGPGFIY